MRCESCEDGLVRETVRGCLAALEEEVGIK